MRITKKSWIVLFIFLLTSACQFSIPKVESSSEASAPTTIPTNSPTVTPDKTSAPLQPPSPSDKKRCGDGVCSAPENSKNCPQDCISSDESNPETVQNTKVPAGENDDGGNRSGEGILYIGIMVHLEGWDDDVNQERFMLHTRVVREYAELFEKYGGKLTLESKEMTEGIHRWGDNVLLEMEQRGHGIGVHADLGGEKNYDCARFTAELRERKQRLEALGVTVRHVSGNTSTCDWVTASADAGYLFTTGQVAYSVSSMPVEKRPPEYRNCPSPAACHDVFPTDLADRIHPWRANSGADWTSHDPNGRLVILSSSSGIKQIYEETHGLAKNKNMEFTGEDVDAYFEQLEEALTLSTPDQVNIFYVSWSLGSELDRAVTEEWLKRLQPYIESGRVQWKTLPEMYDAFIEMEN